MTVSRLAPNDRAQMVEMGTILNQAAVLFSLTLSNEDAATFGRLCKNFTHMSGEIYFANNKTVPYALVLPGAATIVLLAALFILATITNPIGLIAASIVALGALAVMITGLLAYYGCRTEFGVIEKSEAASSYIRDFKLPDFARDASGSLLFSAKRFTEKKPLDEEAQDLLATGTTPVVTRL